MLLCYRYAVPATPIWSPFIIRKCMKDKHPPSRWELLKGQLNNLDPERFRTAIDQRSDSIMIDCRTSREVAAGKIPGAINIDYLAPDFWDQIEHLDADRPYFVYCRSGRRSIRTCTLMQNGGFSRVFNLDGGLNAWIEAFGPASLIDEDSCLDAKR